MYAVVSIAILLAMGLALARAMVGPTTYDRVLAVNVFGTKTVLIIAVVSFMMGRPEFIDIAIVYALINFIGVIAVLKFFEYGSFAVDGADDAEAEIVVPEEALGYGSFADDVEADDAEADDAEADDFVPEQRR